MSTTYPTPEFLRSMPVDGVPAELRDEVLALHLAIADALEQRGFYASPTLFLVTEQKALEVETRGITDAGTHTSVPGWRFFFEGKVCVNDAGDNLEPVLAMEATETVYDNHAAALDASERAMGRWGWTWCGSPRSRSRGPCTSCRPTTAWRRTEAGE